MSHLNTPIQNSFRAGSERVFNDQEQNIGKELPCHVVGRNIAGSIVTVSFDISSAFTLPNVTIPVFGYEYIRYPIQIGDKGTAIAFDARLGGNSGLGAGTSDLSQPGNLSALVFMPIGNINWSEVDPNALTMYGLNGVVLRDTGSNCIIALTQNTITIIGKDTVVINSGPTSIVLNSNGSFNISGTDVGVISAAGGLSLSDSTYTANISTMQGVFAAMIDFLNNHIHTAPASGGDTTVANTPYSGGNPIS